MESECATTIELSLNQIASWNLRRLRNDAGMTQQRLADLMTDLGVAWTAFTVSDAERAADRPGKGRRFNPDELALLALLFGVTPTELLVPPSPSDLGEEPEHVAVMVRLGKLLWSREQYVTDVLLRPSGMTACRARDELEDRYPPG